MFYNLVVNVLVFWGKVIFLGKDEMKEFLFDYSNETWRTLYEAALQFEEEIALDILLNLKENQKDSGYLRRSIVMLLQLGDKEVNNELVKIYNEKPSRFKKSYLGKSFKELLIQYQLL